MPDQIKTHNRHPVDRLHDVRSQIKALQDEEKALKDSILDSGDVMGDDYVAMAKDATRKTLDRPALEARFGKEAIAECVKESSFAVLTLYQKASNSFE